MPVSDMLRLAPAGEADSLHDLADLLVAIRVFSNPSGIRYPRHLHRCRRVEVAELGNLLS